MFRNSTLYRRLWYVKRRRTRAIHMFIRLASILIIFALLVTYTQKKLIPNMAEVAELKYKAILSSAVNNAIREEFSNGISYDDLVTVDKDSEGSITSIHTNMAKVGSISAQVSSTIQEQLDLLKSDTVDIPLGVLVGLKIFGDMGPDIHTRMVPAGSVQAEFRSEFLNSGANRTTHRVYLQIKTKIRITAPLLKKQVETMTEIPVAETVIVGKVPEL